MLIFKHTSEDPRFIWSNWMVGVGILTLMGVIWSNWREILLICKTNTLVISNDKTRHNEVLPIKINILCCINLILELTWIKKKV